VRFAPSPTGYLHVGGARTALFNWLFARREGGVFILRVEDTDVERNRPELVEGILAGLRWLGLDWDEGPVHQSERLGLYRAAADKLIASGAAYFCYCPPEKYGSTALATGGGEPVASAVEPPVVSEAEPAEEAPEGTDGSTGLTPERKEVKRARRCTCAALTADEREQKEREGLPRAVRFRVPESGRTAFEDAVFGPREVENAEIEDFVLLRSTGLPTYQLGAVVDDIEMRISHIIRGADHLSNTPKQVLLYRALGATPPVFAHVPLILGPDRTRLSKRHGATSVGAYAEQGFLPEAFRNFLALLGWSPGDDTEFLRTGEIIRRFSLAGVSRTNAVFDRAKLEWFNTQYLQQLPIEELLPHVEAELRRAGLWQEEWGGPRGEWLARTVDLLRPRSRLLPDFSGWARAFFSDDFDYDPQAREKFWKDARLTDLLGKLADRLEALADWNHDACDAALRRLAEEAGVKAGLLINAARVAIVGQAVAPPLFDTMAAIGKDRVVARLRRALPSLTTR
jgi:glutamyl-tRNA synthetase